jgi:DNA (cytosine-5)-methyltransferase 1
MNEYLTLSEASELIGKSKETLRRWDREGRLSAVREPISNYRVYNRAEVQTLFNDFLTKETKDTTSNYVKPENDYNVLELFAGAGGLVQAACAAGFTWYR